ncbi:peptide methionine sulfoxide reductase MsrA [Persicobacter psychrovividus]|uniref:Peptide methionine sulfoxide reductase MsrA n=2 Tax=Persicobacter psychrovividus TaxID=387638 RepID=A0ABM7VCU3_9BACT|nr:peptide methionine sulfoxide reductase MsrA [Persicobacter psychrovividus]
MEIATLGGGCFWCVEAVMQRLNGVVSVVSGYEGGSVENPTYKQISSGLTGHAEVVQVTYQPDIIDYKTILEVFFTTHDPTTLNRQGNDVGTQYRSVIFYNSPEQKQIADKVIADFNNEQLYPDPIITEVSPSKTFYKAEEYHQNYYNENADKNPYCSFVVAPKVQKLRKKFKHLLKAE